MKPATRIIVAMVAALMLSTLSPAQVKVTTPAEQFGFEVGADYRLISYEKMIDYWKVLADQSPRMILEDIGKTAEGRTQVMAIITSPENHANLAKYKEIAEKLAHAKEISSEEAKSLAREGKAVIWIDGGLHATEVVGSQQLIEMVYQMVSLDDPETMRFLNDIILLAVPANPDGQDMVADWYMRNPNEKERSTGGLPRLYHKYVGHDNNRDSYMATMPETENMARIMYREWFPQIMYNHHQTGPSDLIVFVPPFRDPPNYWYDPLLVTEIQSVGLAMHSRLIAEGKPGSGMRMRSSYSTWFNGNLRTTGYFHNQIGILTEIKGNPTPVNLAFYPDRQLPSNDMPMPHKPGVFKFREAIDYSITMNRAILDYASSGRERLLYNRYLMGRNHIEKGSRDNWTVHPDIVDMVVSDIEAEQGASDANASSYNRRGRGNDIEHFEFFKKPENRDPRGYILPADQADFPTATQFVNTFIKNGIEVMKAKSEFTVNGKKYPAGSYVFKTDQAFRPHILDLFEPQDHPDDFMYPGGPPIPPYDNAGYTLAFQMGIEFDRILDDFSGPFELIKDLEKPLPGKVTGAKNPAGYLLSHETNNSAIAVNRLLKQKSRIYWLRDEIVSGGVRLSPGTIYIPAKGNTQSAVTALAVELGLNFTGVETEPAGEKIALNPVRIGLWDRYGGSMESGWTRWLLEQYEFPFQLVFPQELDRGGLEKKFDVLVFVSGAIREGSGSSTGYGRGADPGNVPEEYRSWLGSVSSEQTVPQLLDFMRKGGSVVTIGSSTALGTIAGLPFKDHIVDGNDEGLKSQDYYIPSSILQVRIDNSLPVAYGMSQHADIFFDNSPVFRLMPEASSAGLKPVAWFDSDRPLRSGWAWGQDRLYGGTAIAEASIGEGKLYLFGPEILFRAQSHGTFKLFFNSLYLSSAK